MLIRTPQRREKRARSRDARRTRRRRRRHDDGYHLEVLLFKQRGATHPQEMKRFIDSEAHMDTDPSAFATWAEPLEDDIFEWHFALYGAEGTRDAAFCTALFLSPSLCFVSQNDFLTFTFCCCVKHDSARAIELTIELLSSLPLHEIS